MQLSELSKKPTLIEVILDDEEVIKEYNESLIFWTFDRQPLDVFLKMANAKQDDPSSMIKALKPLILDKDGKQVIQGENVIPTNILVKAIAKLIEILGK